MTDTSLENIIRELIYEGTEGEYWDFKEKPYIPERESDKNKKKQDLLHDIICMANNLSNRDAYIIMGVSDSPVKVIGVQNYKNRWTTEDYLDFIESGKKWAGGYIPKIQLKTIVTAMQNEIDVLIIKKTATVPYYLSERFGAVNPNQIYVRKGAKNTPKNKQAEIHDIEKLWSYRFGLIPYPKDRVLNYICDVDSWEEMISSSSGKSWYYSKFPEYTIEMFEDEEISQGGNPGFTIINDDQDSYPSVIQVKYHQTVMFRSIVYYIDGARGIVVSPKKSFLPIEYFQSDTIKLCFYYFHNSMELELSRLLIHMMFSFSGDPVSKDQIDSIPIFINEVEKSEVINFIQHNISYYEMKVLEYKKELKSDSHVPQQVDSMATTMMVKLALNDMRQQTN